VAGVQVKILKTEEECPLEEKQLLEVELLGYYLQYFCGENQMLTILEQMNQGNGAQTEKELNCRRKEEGKFIETH
jgi:hypothetical protein